MRKGGEYSPNTSGKWRQENPTTPEWMETIVNVEEESTAWNNTWNHPSRWAEVTDLPIVQGTVIMQEQARTEPLPGKEEIMTETDSQNRREKSPAARHLVIKGFRICQKVRICQ